MRTADEYASGAGEVADLLRHGAWYKGVPCREVEEVAASIAKGYREMSGSELVEAYSESYLGHEGVGREPNCSPSRASMMARRTYDGVEVACLSIAAFATGAVVAALINVVVRIW